MVYYYICDIIQSINFVTKKSYKIGVISLGCPKNQVDTEQMLGVLESAGFHITPEQNEADILVVNTCGFIESAKEESIEAILDAAKMKRQGICKKVIITGCLTQRYKDELVRELPEVDAMVGTTQIHRIGDICKALLASTERVLDVSSPTMIYGLPRKCTTPLHYRYLKIAEGCSNRCSYCAIPIIRGDFFSRPASSIIEEANVLASEGAKELILLAQDSTGYLDGEINLSRLLKKLVKVKGIQWVRLMYAYPGRISKDLMNVMAEEAKICKYLDIPIQHFDDKVLKAMNRYGTSDDIRRTIESLRLHIPGIALRTAMIVGFPGETDAAFKRLLAFVNEAEFEHLGVFTYSREEGTPANELKASVPPEIAQDRFVRIMEAQAKISLKKNRSLVGKHRRVLIDCLEDMVLMGRLQTQAPEIDGAVYLSEIDASPGMFIDVIITDATEYDLMGTAYDPDREIKKNTS